MNPIVGWGLAAAGIAAGYVGWGWPGALLGITVMVFWLLLQFSRSLRVLKLAGQAPVGHVDSAVMLQRKLKDGMSLMQVLVLTRSLGTKLPANRLKSGAGPIPAAQGCGWSSTAASCSAGRCSVTTPLDDQGAP